MIRAAVQLLAPASKQLCSLWRRISYPSTTAGTLCVYGVVVAVLLASCLAVVWPSSQLHTTPTPGGDHPLPNRVAYFAQHAQDYDLVLLGDSKTYCGIHPEFIDPLLGTRAINLSVFSNWFPTQYTVARDAIRLAKPGTNFVWSIGHVNFWRPAGIWRVYPIDIATALQYELWGVPRKGLWDNVFYYKRWTAPLTDRRDWNTRLRAWFDHSPRWARALARFMQWDPAPRTAAATAAAPASAAPSSVAASSAATTAAVQGGASQVPSDPYRAEAEALVRRWSADPRVTYASVVEDGGRVTSVTVYMRAGGYYRIELDHAFFRGKQQSRAMTDDDARTDPITEPDPGMWRLFLAILAQFKEAKVNLVVNEIEEAPYTYSNPIWRKRLQDFMRERVQPEVERMGFTYIRGDTSQLVDSDYFDYNHLNSTGVRKYAPLFAEALKPHLHPGAR